MPSTSHPSAMAAPCLTPRPHAGPATPPLLGSSTPATPGAKNHWTSSPFFSFSTLSPSPAHHLFSFTASPRGQEDPFQVSFTVWPLPGLSCTLTDPSQAPVGRRRLIPAPDPCRSHTCDSPSQLELQAAFPTFSPPSTTCLHLPFHARTHSSSDAFHSLEKVCTSCPAKGDDTGLKSIYETNFVAKHTGSDNQTCSHWYSIPEEGGNGDGGRCFGSNKFFAAKSVPLLSSRLMSRLGYEDTSISSV